MSVITEVEIKEGGDLIVKGPIVGGDLFIKVMPDVSLAVGPNSDMHYDFKSQRVGVLGTMYVVTRVKVRKERK